MHLKKKEQDYLKYDICIKKYIIGNIILLYKNKPKEEIS